MSAARKACHGANKHEAASGCEARRLDSHMLRITGPEPLGNTNLQTTRGIMSSKSSSATEQQKYLWVFSGCQDSQTSADVSIGGTRRGAFTWAFTKALADMD